MGQVTASQAPASGPGNAWYTVGVLFVALIFSFVDRIVLSLLVEPIKADLGLTDADFGWLLGVAFAIFFAFFGLPIGRLADRHSRRLIIGIGISLWSLMTMACGLAGNFWELFFARIGVAIGEAALAPAAFSMVADLFPREKLGRAIGVYQAGAFVGAGIAFLVGGVVIHLITASTTRVLPVIGAVEPWQLVFFVVGLPGVLVALLVFTAPEPARGGRSPGAGAEMPVREVAGYIAARWRVYVPHLVGFALLAVPITTTLTWAPVYFGRILKFPPSQTALTLGLIILLLSPAGVYAGGWTADTLMRRGHRDAMHRVGLAAAAALFPLSLFATTGDNRALAVALFCPLAFCGTLTLACAPAALQVVTPAVMRAQISAVWMLCLNVVTAMAGPTPVGLIAHEVFGDRMAVGQALAIVNGISVPLAALALWLGRRPFAAAVPAPGAAGRRDAGTVIHCAASRSEIRYLWRTGRVGEIANGHVYLDHRGRGARPRLTVHGVAIPAPSGRGACRHCRDASTAVKRYGPAIRLPPCPSGPASSHRAQPSCRCRIGVFSRCAPRRCRCRAAIAGSAAAVTIRHADRRRTGDRRDPIAHCGGLTPAMRRERRRGADDRRKEE